MLNEGDNSQLSYLDGTLSVNITTVIAVRSFFFKG